MAQDPNSIEMLLSQIRQNVIDNPNNLEPVITELNSILNKYDPEILQDKSKQLPLYQSNFNADFWLDKIAKTSNKKLKIPQIRFKADKLSKDLKIPLPNSTRKHKEPLLLWYQINWDKLEKHVQNWKDEENIPEDDEV